MNSELRRYEKSMAYFRETLIQKGEKIDDLAKDLFVVFEDHSLSIVELNADLEAILELLKDGEISKEDIKESRELGLVPLIIKRIEKHISLIELIAFTAKEESKKVRRFLKTYTETFREIQREQ